MTVGEENGLIREYLDLSADILELAPASAAFAPLHERQMLVAALLAVEWGLAPEGATRLPPGDTTAFTERLKAKLDAFMVEAGNLVQAYLAAGQDSLRYPEGDPSPEAAATLDALEDATIALMRYWCCTSGEVPGRVQEFVNGIQQACNQTFGGLTMQ